MSGEGLSSYRAGRRDPPPELSTLGVRQFA